MKKVVIALILLCIVPTLVDAKRIRYDHESFNMMPPAWLSGFQLTNHETRDSSVSVPYAIAPFPELRVTIQTGDPMYPLGRPPLMKDNSKYDGTYWSPSEKIYHFKRK